MMNRKTFLSRVAGVVALFAMFLIAPVTTVAQEGGSDGSTAIRWNEIARRIAAENASGAHGLGGRTYALMSVAQWAAAEQAEAGQSGIAVAVASAEVLRGFFPGSAASIDSELNRDRRAASGDVARAEAIGRAAAQQALALAKTDGHDVEWTGSLRSGQNLWVSAPGEHLVGPHWRSVRPWVIPSGDAFRAPAPPEVGQREFVSALEEVLNVERNRTAEQIAIAEKWANPVDGYWNEVAAGLATAAGYSDAESARFFSLLNMAMVDATIACYDSKYHYQHLRPSHANRDLTMVVPLPNHPSYPSGHACVSGAGSEVIARFFPNVASEVRATAEEIAMSRLYAGVHYRYDNDVGLEMGQTVAGAVVDAQPAPAALLAR